VQISPASKNICYKGGTAPPKVRPHIYFCAMQGLKRPQLPQHLPAREIINCFTMGSMKLKRSRGEVGEQGEVELSTGFESAGEESGGQSDNEEQEQGIKTIQNLPKRIKRTHQTQILTEQTMSGAYTGEVYKSNLFKLQVDDLLDTVRPKFSRIEKSIAELLQTVKSIVEAIPNREPISVSRVLCIVSPLANRYQASRG
jgi:hypothetical protein